MTYRFFVGVSKLSRLSLFLLIGFLFIINRKNIKFQVKEYSEYQATFVLNLMVIEEIFYGEYRVASKCSNCKQFSFSRYVLSSLKSSY